MQEVAIRALQLNDAQHLLEFFKKLTTLDPERAERVDIVQSMTIAEESDWIKSREVGERRRELIARQALVDGSVTAIGEIERKKRLVDSHVADIRIGILPETDLLCTHEEVGVLLGRELLSKAQQIGIEVLVYEHFASQKLSTQIIRRLRFKQVGVIQRYYKRDGKQIDRVIYALNL